MAALTGIDVYGAATGIGDLMDGRSSDVGGPAARSWRDLGNSRDDPLMQFDWDCLFVPPSPLTALGSEYVEEIQVPMPKFDSESVTYQARRYFYAKYEEIGAASVKLYESNKLVSLKAMRSWQSRIKTPNGNYRVPKEYKGKLIVWPKDAKQTNIAKIEMIGIFPTVVPPMSFTGENQRAVLDCEFSVDYVNIVFAY